MLSLVLQNNPFPSRHQTVMFPASFFVIWVSLSWTDAHFVGITKPSSVITELGWNSHCWFSWKRSHLNVPNHPLSTSGLFWQVTSAIWHPHAVSRVSLLPCPHFRQQEVAPYFPTNAVTRVLSQLYEELIQGVNPSFPLGWSLYNDKTSPPTELLLNYPFWPGSGTAYKRHKMWSIQIPSDPNKSPWPICTDY